MIRNGPCLLSHAMPLQNLPAYFPFTAGVFAFKREGEEPARMFAGEGDAFRTNRRFKLVSEGSQATRLSTAGAGLARARERYRRGEEVPAGTGP
jgi:methylmalonyl-CoA mutase N-terminal domain/subunit